MHKVIKTVSRAVHNCLQIKIYYKTNAFTKYIFPFFSKMVALHKNMTNSQHTLTVFTLRCKILLQGV